MINFEEELAKFQPSLEVSDAEDVIYNNDMTDVGDIMKQMLDSMSNTKEH
ncbi:MAG: hypothetical protein IJD02_06100 [Lachnospiraceae bacterium]|nr:hypothetical protein [Lachnospiraceae bacterium]